MALNPSRTSGGGKSQPQPKQSMPQLQQQQQELDPEQARLQLLDAYKSGKRDQLRRLLTRAGLYATVDGNKTLADLAAEDGDGETLKALKSSGVDFDRRNTDGLTPFHYAMRRGRANTLVLLRRLGASADLPMPAVLGAGMGDYPLHAACDGTDARLLNVLLDQCGANPDVRDAQGNSPLHRACLEDNVAAVRALLPRRQPALLNLRGHDGRTALHIAVLNQSRLIVNLLLSCGALVDVPADSGKTVIDLILQTSNPVLLNDFARFYTVRMTDGAPVSDLASLCSQPQFLRYLEFLSNVDNEFSLCSLESHPVGSAELAALPAKLRDENRIDVVEFKEVILRLLQTEEIHSLCLDYDTLVKVVENIVHYVLFREDADLLERIMQCGPLWSRIAPLLEENLDSLYLQTPEREVNGIIAHFRANFVRDGRVMHDRLVGHYGHKLACFGLPASPSSTGGGREPMAPYMRHPMHSLTVWSVLSGRLRLIQLLLRQERFDVVPLALFCAGLLRTFPDNQELAVDADEIKDLALTCERFARKVTEKVNSIDTSYGRSVSSDYLLRPLEAYGGVTCIRLAAGNSCDDFLQSEVCQRALDRQWYRSLHSMPPGLREMLIWMGAVPFNVFAPLLLLYFDETEAWAARRHEERSFVGSENGAQTVTKFRLTLPTVANRSEAVDRKSLDFDSSIEAADSELQQQWQQQQRRTKSIDNQQRQQLQQQQQPESVQLLAVEARANPISAPDSDSAPRSLIRPLSEPGGRTGLAMRLSRFFKLIDEFYSVPAVKFHYHVASHLLLVLLLSYLLLVDFKYSLSIKEGLVYAILFGFLLEEAVQVMQSVHYRDFRSYFRTKWNLIDVAGLTSGCLGFGLRAVRLGAAETDWSEPARDFDDNLWYMSRVMLSICCMLYWIRLLYVSTVLENLGPKLKMIATMITKDLLPFLLILFIFIFGFGVLIHSLLYPNGFRAWNPNQLTKVQVFFNMLKICFYSMVGEYSLDILMGEEVCELLYANGTANEESCPHQFGRYLVPYVVLPLYVIVTEILLLNLIVAMFSKTVETIDSRSKGLWQFERHDLIEEFEGRSRLPPPLNALDLARRLFVPLAQRLCARTARSGTFGRFSQKLVLQFLLFQAFGLRNSRAILMRLSLPKQETETDEMLQRVREIVEDAMDRVGCGGQDRVPPPIYRNTLLEARPPVAHSSGDTGRGQYGGAGDGASH